MSTPPPVLADAAPSRGLAALFEILRRRRTVAVVPFLLVAAATVSLALGLPNLWSAKALVRMDRQRISESLVKSGVGDLERQLLSISQEIMSRPRLQKIIEDLRLYSASEPIPNGAVERMRGDITIDVIGAEDRAGMRDDSRLVAFSLAYRARDPQVAMTVANRLAELYVEENSLAREAQAARGSQFLDVQLTEVRARLQESERRVGEYKERHMGELPEQRDATLRTLERLQQQQQVAQENLRRANERQQLLTRTLADIDQTNARGGPVVGAGELDISPSQAAAGRLTLLRQELNETIRRRGENHPDVASVRAQIAAAETRLEAARLKKDSQPSALARQPLAPGRAADRPERRPAPENAYVVSLMHQLDQANVEAKALGQDIAALNGQTNTFQRRLDNTPRHERELARLTQDYDALKELFRALMNKRGEAEITADLEQRQKGETFRVLDMATAPQTPLGPNRLRLLMMGLALAVGLSAVAVIAAEQLDTSYRSADEVRASLAVPVVSSIPMIVTDADRGRRIRRRFFATTAVASSLVLVVLLAFVMARNNESLATMLSPKTPIGARH